MEEKKEIKLKWIDKLWIGIFLAVCLFGFSQWIDKEEEIRTKGIKSVAEYEQNKQEHEYYFYPKDSGKILNIYVEENGILYLSHVEGITDREGNNLTEEQSIDKNHWKVEAGDVYQLTLPKINEENDNDDTMMSDALVITAYIIKE